MNFEEEDIVPFYKCREILLAVRKDRKDALRRGEYKINRWQPGITLQEPSAPSPNDPPMPDLSDEDTALLKAETEKFRTRHIPLVIESYKQEARVAAHYVKSGRKTRESEIHTDALVATLSDPELQQEAVRRFEQEWIERHLGMKSSASPGL